MDHPEESRPPVPGESCGPRRFTRWTRSMSFRFLVRILIPMLVASFLFMFVFGHMSRLTLLGKIDAEADAYATALARLCGELLMNSQKSELKSALATLESDPALLGATIYDAQGDPYLKYGDTTSPLRIERDLTREVPPETALPLGRLVVYYSHHTAEKEFRHHFLGQIFRLLLIILIITGATLYAFDRTVSAPLRELLEAIRRAECEARWTPVKWESDDEIGDVIKAHNRMVRHVTQKEQALADSEQRYRQLFDGALVGLFQVRPDGTVKEANRTVADILGYPSTEGLHGINVIELYADPSARDELWAILRDQGEISRFRTRFKRYDGKIIWAELTGQLTTDDTFNGVVQDITSLMEARQAMEDRDELHRAFFEENKAVMLLHDPLDSTIVFANPAACRFYGYTLDELTSMTIRQLDAMTDDEVFAELKSAAAERRHYFKQTHHLKNGTSRQVEVFTGPVSMGNRQLHYSIIHDVTDKRRLESKLERMATRDQLTGAYNRHAFFQLAKDELIRAARHDHPLALLMFDLDHFKSINDTHGHGVGDEVLRVFALRCRADLRQNDIFARIGGEEFAAMLTRTDRAKALEVAQRIRAMAAENPISTDAGELTVTTSIGLASLMPDDTVASLINRADSRLYKAKENGRNKVVDE